MSKTFRLGLFVVGTLAVFAAGVFIIGNKEFLFNSTYRLNAEFANVGGLVDGAPVRVGGMQEGTVTRIVLPQDPSRKVRVELSLNGATRGVVKKDSVASIQSDGLVGDRYVEVSFGSEGAPKVNNGDYLSGEPPTEFGSLLKKADAILDGAQQTVQNINQTTGNLSAITGKVNSGQGTVGALINNQSAYQQMNAGAAEFREDMEALKHNFLLRGYFKNRGYEDSADLAKYAIVQLPAAPPAEQFTFDADKLFDKPDSAKLKDEKTLKPAGQYLQSHPFGLAVVAVYTGMKGDTDKDRVLAEARAYAAREYLVKNFRFDDTRVKTAGIGKNGEEGSTVAILVYPQGASAPNPQAVKRP
jgi:phospholipid/cholesterol/gamma-HCH transport system substrate-binding protein